MKELKFVNMLIVECLENQNISPNKLAETLVLKSSLKNLNFSVVKQELKKQDFDIIDCLDMKDKFVDLPASQQKLNYYVFKV